MDTGTSFSSYAAEGDWHLLLSRYVLCSPWVQNRRALDLVCGRGLGCELLRRAGADHVVGVDTRHEVIHWASQNLATHGLGFHNLPRGSSLPFAEGSFEIVVALNPSRGFGDVHFREVRRVLARDGVLVVAQTESHGGTFQELLPFYDRAPIGEPVAPADTRLLGDLFGEPQVILEDPVLGMHYRLANDATDVLGWPAPDSRLADDPASMKSPLARIVVYGLAPGQVGQRIVELPYTEVAEKIEQTIGEYGRAREAVGQENESLRAQLIERTRAVEALESQLAVERSRSSTATFEAVGNAASSLLYGWKGLQEERQPTNNPETDAYVQELWQSACDWKEHAERLTEQLKEAGSAVSEREAELSRQISQLRGNLEEETAKHNRLEAELPALNAQLETMTKEGVQRDEYLSQLRNRLEEKENRLDQFAEEMAVHLEDLHVTKRELERANQSLDSVEEKKEKKEKETINLDQAVRTKSARIQTLEREAVSHNIEISSLEKEAGRLLKAKAEADRETRELKDKLAEALARVTELTSKSAVTEVPEPSATKRPRGSESKKAKRRPAQPELALGTPLEIEGDPRPVTKRKQPKAQTVASAEPAVPGAEPEVAKPTKTRAAKANKKPTGDPSKAKQQETAAKKGTESEAAEATAPDKPKRRTAKAKVEKPAPKKEAPPGKEDKAKKKPRSPASPTKTTAKDTVANPPKRKAAKKPETAAEGDAQEQSSAVAKAPARKKRKPKTDSPAPSEEAPKSKTRRSKRDNKADEPKAEPKKRTRTKKKATPSAAGKPAETKFAGKTRAKKEDAEPKPKRKRTRSKPADK